MRSTKERAEKYAACLQKQGIPAWYEQRGGLLRAREVACFVSLLKVLNNPMDDVSLLSAMMSALFAFTPDEMAQIRLCARREDLYTAVLTASRQGDTKCADFLADLEEMRRWAAMLPTDRLIGKVYDYLGYLPIVEAMENGAQRRANLLMLLEYAREFESSASGGLSGFLRYLARLDENDSALDAAGTASENDDVVRIMSIHRSKGLQFPVCILAGNFVKFNMSDSRAPIVLHSEAGIGLMTCDDAQQLRRTTFMREAVSLRAQHAAMAEELRVLYVAMTRAQEKLVMLITGKDLEDTVGKIARRMEGDWQGKGRLDAYGVQHAVSSAELLLSCALVHPDGTVLREIADVPLLPCDTPSRLLIRFGDAQEMEQDETTEPQVCESDPEMVRMIRERLDYQYPYAALNGVAAKRSVSQMAKQQAGTEREYDCTARPRFMMKSGLTPAERGTVLHQFMQYADYTAAKTDVQGELERLVEQGFLDRWQQEAVDIAKLKDFFANPLYRRMESSPKVLREVRFMAEIPATRLDPNLPDSFAQEGIVVQGIADCVFVEEDHLVIVDYKTDRAKDETVLRSHYAPQLDVYAEALSQSLSMPVKEKILYSFHLGPGGPM